ncbi:vWA domain-containing protein [Pelotomaculum propionicicum]|uniref:vWA domain-containing protein n=1 Tax=Pelotomaculum propionicicum TaxID=258475 RepID=UPI003B7B80A6
MRRVKKNIIISISLIMVFLFSFSVSAQEQNKAEGLALALVIDGSGSMKENDPNNVRLEAAKKAIALLGEDDQVCVVEFSDVVSVLVPLRKVGGAESRNEIISKLSAIGVKGDTDIKGGMTSALAELKKADGNKKKLALLLSDGVPDMPDLLKDPNKMMAYLADVDKTAGDFKSSGWSIHSIALQKEEAGQLLKKIAQQTSGEYFFVKDAAELTTFFQSILLVQKYSQSEKPELAYLFENRTYKVGDKVPVYASLKVGSDNLIPGPHLKLDKFELAVSYANQEPVIIALKDDGTSGDAQAGDGVFSCLVPCTQKGEASFTLVSQGTYLNESIDGKAELPKIQIKPEISAGRDFLNKINALAVQYKYIIFAVSLAVAALICIVALLRKSNDRKSMNIKGSLEYWLENDSEGFGKVLDLSRYSKDEILLATENGPEVDILLPVAIKNFAFKIKKYIKNKTNVKDIKDFNLIDSKIFYMVTCMPGTYLVSNGTPMSREQIFNNDKFDLGGYTFKFVSREAKNDT